jgi:uncharacterized surface protein with fasciclin (FAS1) repeats
MTRLNHMARLLPLLAALWSCVPAPPVAAPPVAPTLAVANPLPDAMSMPAARTAGANLASAPGLTRTAAAMLAGGRGLVLQGPGPLTLLAPSDAAWGRLAPGTADALLEPQNRPLLLQLLDAHLLRGRVTLAELRQRVRAAGGRAELTTMGGTVLVVTEGPGGAIALTDAQGDHAWLEVADLPQANGLVHVVNGVLVPSGR